MSKIRMNIKRFIRTDIDLKDEWNYKKLFKIRQKMIDHYNDLLMKFDKIMDSKEVENEE